MMAVELAAGSTLGPYRIEKKLGEGGMGAVYKATHQHLEKSFAVKVLPPALTQNPDAVARFRREMKAVGKVDHPHIVRATDAGEANGVHFLAMEFVEGTDLQQLVRTRGPLSVANACKATRQAAMALLAAHGAGLVHRDVKPSNLLVQVEGLGLMVEGESQDSDLPSTLDHQPSTFHIKLLDLGLARLSLDPAMTTELTTEGQTFGTPDYMAPEQWQDAHNADSRADLYSLGCTLFFVLTGRAPFGTEQYKTLASKMTAHITGTMPDLSAIRADVPAGVCEIFQKLTAKNPRDRFPSAADVVTALGPWTKTTTSRDASKVAITAPRDEPNVAITAPRDEPRGNTSQPTISLPPGTNSL
jgi:serine/threonine protein kinase